MLLKGPFENFFYSGSLWNMWTFQKSAHIVDKDPAKTKQLKAKKKTEVYMYTTIFSILNGWEAGTYRTLEKKKYYVTG